MALERYENTAHVLGLEHVGETELERIAGAFARMRKGRYEGFIEVAENHTAYFTFNNQLYRIMHVTREDLQGGKRADSAPLQQGLTIEVVEPRDIPPEHIVSFLKAAR